MKSNKPHLTRRCSDGRGWHGLAHHDCTTREIRGTQSTHHTLRNRLTVVCVYRTKLYTTGMQSNTPPAHIQQVTANTHVCAQKSHADLPSVALELAVHDQELAQVVSLRVRLMKGSAATVALVLRARHESSAVIEEVFHCAHGKNIGK